MRIALKLLADLGVVRIVLKWLNPLDRPQSQQPVSPHMFESISLGSPVPPAGHLGSISLKGILGDEFKTFILWVDSGIFCDALKVCLVPCKVGFLLREFNLHGKVFVF